MASVLYFSVSVTLGCETQRVLHAQYYLCSTRRDHLSLLVGNKGVEKKPGHNGAGEAYVFFCGDSE